MNISVTKVTSEVAMTTTVTELRERRFVAIMENSRLIFLRTETVVLSHKLLRSVRKIYLKLIKR